MTVDKLGDYFQEEHKDKEDIRENLGDVETGTIPTVFKFFLERIKTKIFTELSRDGVLYLKTRYFWTTNSNFSFGEKSDNITYTGDKITIG